MKYLYLLLYFSCCHILLFFIFAYIHKSNPLIIIGSTLPLWWLTLSFSKAVKPSMFNLPMYVLLHGPSASAHFRSAVNVQVSFSKYSFFVFWRGFHFLLILFIYLSILCIDFNFWCVYVYIWLGNYFIWGVCSLFTFFSFFLLLSYCFCFAYLALLNGLFSWYC